MAPRKKAKSSRKAKANSANDVDVSQVAAPSTNPVFPLEVFLEVFEYAEPRELLQLARTNKTFRAVLMRSKAARIWDQALARIAPPIKCPSYMSLPFFCSVAFESFCSICGIHARNAPYWRLRLRLCPKCKESKTSSVVRHPQPPLFTQLTGETLRGSRKQIFLVEDSARFWKELEAQKTDKGRVEVDRKYAQLMRDIRQCSTRIQGWHSSYRKEEEKRERARKEALLQDRLAQITSKLKAMPGWKDGYNELLEECLQSHADVYKPVALEANEWKTLGPSLLRALKQRNTTWALEKRIEEHDRRFDHLEKVVEFFLKAWSPEFQPDPIEFYQDATIRLFLEEDLNSTMSRDTVRQHVMPLLPRLLDELRAKADTSFRKLCRQLLQTPDHIDTLQLAMVSRCPFYCDQCSYFYGTYPKILSGHTPCKATAMDNNRGYTSHWRASRTFEAWEELWLDENTRGSASCGRKPSTWDFYRLGYVQDPTEWVIEACQMDKATATILDMDMATDVRFACKFVGVNGVERYCTRAMIWSVAVSLILF
ncbi:hypothetical protein HGRIS_008176 [Hohenbuehelia grisea]|uniref:F-box domain-containing protein n=1 Tax=Hohenbuehelia grisea TaxID=104357 RepID=A0ABR3J782_9AGAR